MSTIRANASKCVVEATFDMDKHKLKTIFDQLDLDEERHTIIRRELSATGKSRAFINDTPVTLDALKAVGNALVDIHTQRQSIQLTDPAFYINLIDAYSDNAKSLAAYKAAFKHWNISTTELESLRISQRQSDEALDYHKFLLNELEQLSLSPDMIATLEEEVHVLKNATGLRAALAEVVSISTQDGLGVQDQMIAISQLLDKIANLGAAYQSL